MHFSDATLLLCFLTNFNMRNNLENKVDRSEYHNAHTHPEIFFELAWFFLLLFGIWFQSKMLLTSRRNLKSAIHLHNIVAILQREVLPAKKLGLNEIQRHKIEFFQKWKLALEDVLHQFYSFSSCCCEALNIANLLNIFPCLYLV